jgi:hypothetical protein
MKETIKEAAKKYPLINQRIGFIEGAKWQQERSYSEEEVLDILYRFHYDLVNSNIDTKEEWFKQFKKK